MANKLSRSVANIERALSSLVAQGVLKAVRRTILNPLTEMQRPVVGIKIVRYGRRPGGVWKAELVLTLITSAGEIADDEPNIDLAAKVDAALDALADSGVAGAVIDCPTWEPWEWRPKADGPLMPIGSVGGLTLTIEGPLLL